MHVRLMHPLSEVSGPQVLRSRAQQVHDDLCVMHALCVIENSEGYNRKQFGSTIMKRVVLETTLTQTLWTHCAVEPSRVDSLIGRILNAAAVVIVVLVLALDY